VAPGDVVQADQVDVEDEVSAAAHQTEHLECPGPAGSAIDRGLAKSCR